MCTSEASRGCATATSGAPATDGTSTTFTVAGMTCGGCANTVARHVSGIAGVTGVQVDVASGAVTVTSHTPLQDADVSAAVEQAGYQLVS
jgi:copper chaperone CopZ